MRTIFLAVFVLCSPLLFADAGTPAVRADGSKTQPVRIVSPADAEKLIEDVPGLIVLDVRTPDEFAAGHIKGARNIDFFDSDFEKQVAALDPAKPVLIHCASGNRSSQALEQIKGSAKFPTIYHLKAGFSGWKAAGKPIETKPSAADKKK